MNATKVIVLLLVLVTAFIFSLFLNLGYTFKFKYFNLQFNSSQLNFLKDILPILYSGNTKNDTNVHFSYFNGIFNTRHIYHQNSNNSFVQNKLTWMSKPLFYTPSDLHSANETSLTLSNLTSSNNHNQEKLIVVYTTTYGIKWLPESWSHDGNLFFLDSPEFTCPKKCVFTDNKNFSRMADAVLIDVLETLYHTKGQQKKFPTPSERKKDQIWIGYTAEAPLYHDASKVKSLNYLFNWTATYRPDSEIYWPYGFFYKLSQSKTLKEIHLPNATLLKSKKLAASMISNCNAWGGRDYVLKSLKKYMKIDSYGKCGNETCPDDTKCREYLGSHYKFFMAFENSLCQDYVTEKFFASFSVGMVPVTFGLGNYAEIAPPHSYINSLDFPNTKALAEYLLHLDKNDEEYLAYFDWRRNYAMGKEEQNLQFCALCLKLWEPIRQKRIPEGFNTWWNHKRNTSVEGSSATLTYKLLHDYQTGCIDKHEILRSGYISK